MNKTIKPILAISLMAILLAPLGGCKQSPPPVTGGQDKTPPPSTTTPATPVTWETVKQQLDELKKSLEQPDSLNYGETQLRVYNWYDHYTNFKKDKQLFSQPEAKEIDELISQHQQPANDLLDNLVSTDSTKIKEAQNILKTSGFLTVEPDGNKDGQDTKKATADYLIPIFNDISIYTNILEILDEAALQKSNVPSSLNTNGTATEQNKQLEEIKKLIASGNQENLYRSATFLTFFLMLVVVLQIFLLMKSDKKQQEAEAGGTPTSQAEAGGSSKVISYDSEFTTIKEGIQSIENLLKNQPKNQTNQSYVEIQNLTKEINKLYVQLVALPPQQQYLTAPNPQIEQLRRDKQELERRLSTVESELVKAESRINSLEKENKNLTRENQNLNREINEIKHRKEETIEATNLSWKTELLRGLKPVINPSKAIASVSVTPDSFSSARQVSSSEIRLNSARASSNNYLVVPDGSNYYLIPNYQQMKFDEYQVAEVLFDCNGYQQGVRSNFRVESPATVVRATGNSSEWVLVAKGQLSFY